MKKNNVKQLSLIFICVGIIFILIAIFFTCSYYVSDYISTTAKIEYIGAYDNDNYDVYVSYKDENNFAYYTKINFYSSTFDVGDNIEIKYNMNNPSDIKVRDSFFMFSGIFGFIGIIFIIIYFIALPFFSRNSVLIKYKKNGIKKSAKVLEFKTLDNFSISFFHPYKIICTARINGIEKVFKSRQIWNNALTDPKNKIVDIYYLTDKKYYVDDTSVRESLDIGDILDNF